jgi:hypothetical protein
MARETYGRWPFVAAAAALPVSIASVRRPGLRPLAALLWHQSEEWYWPGGFLPWINHELFGGTDEFPLDRRMAVVVNVWLGWGVSLVVAAGPRAAAPAVLLYTSHVANAGMHVGWAARHRRYDPGVVTSVVALLPATFLGVRQLLREPSVSRRSLAIGAAGGLAVTAALPVTMRRRLRTRR